MAWKSITEISDDVETAESTKLADPEPETATMHAKICEIECTLKKILAHLERGNASSVITYNERHK